jgi:hypothetical protein
MIVEETEPTGKSKDQYPAIVEVNRPKAARKRAQTPQETDCNPMPYIYGRLRISLWFIRKMGVCT